MEITQEQRKRQEEYLVVMALAKEMKAEGIIDMDDLLKVEAVFAEKYKPYMCYMDFELKNGPRLQK